MAEIALAGGAENQPIGTPHRPDAPITLDYEHASAQAAIGNLRDAYVDLLDRFFATATKAFGAKALKLKPHLATFASWVGYDLDGRNDIRWTFSFLVRIKEKQAALNDIRDRFLGLRGKLGDSAEVQRLSRQITGKLDLAIAAVDEQITALDQVGVGGFTLAEAANVITKPGRLQPRLHRAADGAARRHDRRRAERRGQVRRRRALGPHAGDRARHARTSTCASTPCRSTTRSAPSCTSRGRAI